MADAMRGILKFLCIRPMFNFYRVLMLLVFCSPLMNTGLAKSANEFEKFPWLVRVKSTYFNASTGKMDAQSIGHGFIISTGSDLFVVTAAHVSQGGVKQFFESNGQNDEANRLFEVSYFDSTQEKFINIPTGKRIAHIRRDIELINLPKKTVPSAVEPLAECNQNCIFGETVAGMLLRPGLEETIQNQSFLRLTPKWEKYFESESSFLALDWHQLNLAPMEKWIPKSTVLTDHPLVVTPSKTASLEASNFEMRAPVALSAGMSGMPLLARSNIGGRNSVGVAGIYTSSHRVFSESWFVSSYFIPYVLRQAYSQVRDLGWITLLQSIFWEKNGELLVRSGEFVDPKGKMPRLYFTESEFDRERHGNGGRSDGTAFKQSLVSDKWIDTLKEGILVRTQDEPNTSVLGFLVRWKGDQVLLPGDFHSLIWIVENCFTGALTWESDVQRIYDKNELWGLAFAQLSRRGRQNSDGSLTLNADLIDETNDSYKPEHAQISVRKTIASFTITIEISRENLAESIKFDVIKNGDLRRGILSSISEHESESRRLDMSSLFFASPSQYRFTAQEEIFSQKLLLRMR